VRDAATAGGEAAARANPFIMANAAKPVCLAAGTPIRTPAGHKRIEEIRVGDPILTADENDPTCTLAVRRVDDAFQRFGLDMRVHLGGRTIYLTPDHPSFVPDRGGWVQAGELAAGDEVLCLGGECVTIDRIEDDDVPRTVYNLTVSEYQTFFVGCDEWGFAAWVHNASVCDELKVLQDAVIAGDRVIVARQVENINTLVDRARANPFIAEEFESALKSPENAILFHEQGI
jgi:hypothetical protein